ncbi:MAG: D-aminoacyl-tRNA deacylase [Gammaproteobacteria bacterium]|nr:D-aminoacyl-tRNA deacylase [Gammaproteobacteria bacterium]MDH5654076.1 D-aminoacyl-tRNA deacylase [Gammaproteobacteria bacterium]
MIGLLQRVTSSRVEVAGQVVGEIERGIMVLVGVQKGDDEARAERLAERLLGYRVFPDADDKMNLSVRDIQGGVLLVPQFTLAADTRKGTRAGFSTAAEPAVGKLLFEYLVARIRQLHPQTAAGEFGAYMQVSLINDGPVTFWLDV